LGQLLIAGAVRMKPVSASWSSRKVAMTALVIALAREGDSFSAPELADRAPPPTAA
jgi:hypothetical protein